MSLHGVERNESWHDPVHVCNNRLSCAIKEVARNVLNMSSIYLYTGQADQDLVPDDVVHIRIQPDCKVLPSLAFLLCSSKLKLVEILVGLEVMKERCFYQCFSLKTLQLPYTVRQIGDASFFGCQSLQQVEMHGHGLLTLIGKAAFFGCVSLMAIGIPESVSAIQESAFHACEKMVSIHLPKNGLQMLGPMAFAHCIALEYIAIPLTVCVLESSTFLDCYRLRHVELGQVQRIQNAVFRNCKSLTHVRLPVTLKVIGNHAFSGCTSLLSIELPNALHDIGDFAFASCEALKNGVIPSTVEFVGRHVWGGCFAGFASHEIPKMIRKRFEGLPIHTVCYFQSFYSNAMDQLVQAMEQSGSKSDQKTVDCFGLTPFHILALSKRPNKELWLALLKKHKDIHHCKDHWGHSALDYLYMNNESSGTEDLIRCVVRNPAVWSNGRSRY